MNRRTTATLGLVSLVLAGGTLLAGCGKSHDSTGPGNSNDYFLRFNVNGSAVSFTLQTSLNAAFAHSGTVYNAVIVGFDATRNANVQIVNGSPIGTGTWHDFQIQGSALVGSLIGYQDAGGTLYGTSPGSDADVTVAITKMTDTAVRGTFSGTIVASGHADLVVTNGEFFVPRSN
jgi:hypothetical protein